jgi:hypothetical protein
MDTVEAVLFVCAAVGLGGVAGLGFILIWCWVIPVHTHGLFWRSMADLSKRIVSVDETAEFLALYQRLGTLVVSYTTRNMGGTLLGCLPLVILLWILGPALFTAWDARTEALTVVPEEAGTLVSSENRNTIELHLAGRGPVLNLTREAPRMALCWTSMHCTLLAVFNFHVTRLDSPPLPDLSSVIVRTNTGAWNPAWPLLGGLEFIFFVSFAFMATLGLLWRIKT